MIKFFNILKFVLSVLHLYCFKTATDDIKELIESDIEEMNRRCHQNKGLAYYLVHHKSYRNLFYYRIGGGRKRILMMFFLPPYPFFEIPDQIGKIGKAAFVLNHPYSTIINAKSIGDNFTICQLTTIGNKIHGRNDLVPTIGNNVSLGANVCIMGDITIGDNVIVGAGSIVVKDVPNNCVVAGNPAKIIRYI